MKWHLIFIVALMMTLDTGCGSGDAVSDITELDEDGTASQLADGPAADVESPDVVEVAGFTPPFPGNSSFFSQPEVEKAVVAPGSYHQADDQHATVRVIGFSRIGEGETQALISIQGNLRIVRAGDSVDGVSVVALDPPNLTLQQRSERWSVALFKQPIVNQYASATKTARPRNSTSGRLYATGSSATRRSAVANDAFSETRSSSEEASKRFNRNVPRQISRGNLPPTPVSLHANIIATGPELPDGLDLPELPTLPAIKDVEATRVPGINEIHNLPSFHVGSNELN